MSEYIMIMSEYIMELFQLILCPQKVHNQLELFGFNKLKYFLEFKSGFAACNCV